MSRFKDFTSEQPSETFRDKVLANAKTELHAIRKKTAIRQFWQLAFGSALSLAFISWSFRGLSRPANNDSELLAMQEVEMLQDLDVLDELELLNELDEEDMDI